MRSHPQHPRLQVLRASGSGYRWDARLRPALHQPRDKDSETLPHTVVKSADTAKAFFTQVINSSSKIDSVDLNIEANELNANLYVEDYNAFVELKNSIAAGGYFDVEDQYSTQAVNSNGIDYNQATMLFRVQQAVIDKAQEKLDEANGTSSDDAGAGDSSESSTESSAS